MFRLLTLGRLDLTDPHGREVRSVLSQPKRLALLSYLALANSTRFRRRDSVLSLFWPELDTSHARASLRQALTFLRRSLAEGVILTRGEEEIGVDPSLLWCDAVAFDSACEGNPEEAIRLYHGPFLPGLFVDGAAPELDAWIDAERGRRQRTAVEQARSAAERARARGDLATALQRAQLAVSLSPGEESSVARLIELLDQFGDRARALAEYEAFARRLREEFDTDPAPETQALIQAVRGRSALPSVTRVVDPPAVEPAPGEPTAPAAGPRSSNRRWLLGAGGLLTVGLMSLLALRVGDGSSSDALRYDPNVIAVAPFDVFAPERGFWREGMTDLLSPLLDGAGPLRTIPVRQVLLHWKGRAERESAVELAQATGAGVVVYGRLLWPEPDSIRVLITLLDLGSGEAVDLEVKDLADRIDRAAESLALRVLRQLGETRPVAAVRGGGMGSRSFPALKAFLQGEQYYRRSQPDSALRYFERAIGLDTLFALAWWRRMGTLAMLGPVNDSVVLASGLKAGALNHGLSPRDSLMVVADSIGSVMSRQSGDTLYPAHQVRLHATLEELTRRYPEDAEAWFLLSQARLTGPMGMPLDQTLDAIDRAIRLDSSFLPAWMRHQPVELALRLGEVERARRHLRAKAGGKARPQEVDGYRFAALMLERPRQGYRMLDGWADTAGIRAIVAAIDALTWWPDTGEAAVRLTRVLTRRSRAADTADAGLFPEADWRISGSIALLARGHLREAWSLNPYFVSRMAARFAGAASFAALPAESAAALQPIQGAAWLPIWATRGDTITLLWQRARLDSMARLASGIPWARNRFMGTHAVRDRRLAAYDRARADAYLALARKDTAEAIARFSWLIDSACAGCSWTRLFTDIYSAALLLEARGRGTEAQRWLEYDVMDIPYPVYDVAMDLILARITERSGQLQKAVDAYRRVAQMWANADPELQPMVTEARAALQRLEQRPRSYATRARPTG